MTKSVNKLVVGLEIGTSKTIILIGEILVDNKINILGIGNCKSKGIEEGNINDLESVVKCIKNVIKEAELMSECKISSLYLSITGKHIKCKNEIGILPINNKEVTQVEIDKIIKIAKSIKIHDEYKIIHVIPQEYTIDNHKGIKNPIGLSGIRMKVNVHIVICKKNTIKNIIKAVEKCNVKVDKIIFAGIASSFSVLTKEDKNLGSCIIDIGSSTMDITIYTEGFIRYNAVIPYAGNIVTNDISYAFKLNIINSEKLKIKYGYALSSIINKNENIDISEFLESSYKILNIKSLSEIIEPRYIELLILIKKEISFIQKKLIKSKIKHLLHGGIIFTGGGSKINGLIKCAEMIFQNKIKIGYPRNITGINKSPCYSTVIGLLFYGINLNIYKNLTNKKNNFIYKYFNIIKNWIKKEF